MDMAQTFEATEEHLQQFQEQVRYLFMKAENIAISRAINQIIVVDHSQEIETVTRNDHIA